MTAMLVCVGAFGQGKLSFQVDSTQLIYLTPYEGLLLPADRNKPGGVGGFPFSLAGSSLYAGASLAGSPSFTAALFAGATANSLSQVAITTLADAALAGQLNPVNLTLAGLPAGTTAFFQIQVFDSRATSTANAWATFNPADPTDVYSMYAGETGVFSAVPQASVYSPIWQATAPVSSTLPVGTFVPKDYAAYPGYAGLIEVYAIPSPEPSTFALAGLGAAALIIARRRR